MSQKYISSTLKQNGEGGPELCQIIHAPEVGEFWQEPDLYFHDPAMKFKKAPHCPDHPNKKLLMKRQERWCVGWESREFKPRWAYGISRNICIIASRYSCSNCEKNKRSTNRVIVESFYDVYNPNILFLKKSAIHLSLYNLIVNAINRGEICSALFE